jgi:diguanylate cyclase (GGDEF)-like protein/PAS domain S-box-containing protein
MANALPASVASDRDELLQSVVAGAGDAVMIVATGDERLGPRIVYINAAFTQMTGYGEAEVIDRSPSFLQGAGTSALARAQMRDAIAEHRPVTVEVRNYRKDGSDYLVELSLAPVFDRTGICAHWVSIQRDVTARRNADEARASERIAEEKRLAVLEERRERERMAERLAYAAAHDELTGLFTRSHFIACVATAIAAAADDPDCAYDLLLIDLDRFKLVNEQVGHRTGDAILCDAARCLERVAGPRDIVARLGGDEFGLLHERLGPDACGDIAGRVLAELAARARTAADGIALSASIGIVAFEPQIDDPEVLIHDAQTAVERALRAGGSTSVRVTPELRAEAAAAQRIRNDLPGVVERGELRLFYQPLVDIALGRIYGFEGLVRWKHPTRGLIQPGEFIAAAEEDGHIGEIGRWVLAEGCSKAAEFQARSGQPLLMSLNVSSAQLLDPRFFEHLQGILHRTGLDPHTLQLEITESAFLAGGSSITALFGRVREIGVKIAFDDFGTGYSSLSYLERYQIDSLKIDRSFVQRIHDASAKSEILRMIIALAHALGVDVIAEGVEHRAQRDALGHLGCTHLQGFLFSRPLPESAALELLTPSFAASGALDSLLVETLVRDGALSAAECDELREQVDAAIERHFEWMDLMQEAVASGVTCVDPAAVSADDRCSIGVWLNSTISPRLRSMPLYHVTRSRHAVFHRSMARLFTAVAEGRPEAAQSLRADGDVTMVAASLLRTLADWRAVADVHVPHGTALR